MERTPNVWSTTKVIHTSILFSNYKYFLECILCDNTKSEPRDGDYGMDSKLKWGDQLKNFRKIFKIGGLFLITVDVKFNSDTLIGS